MNKEDEWIEIAKKHMPDLNLEQETLIRRIARCKKYGASSPLKFVQEECRCHLCLQLTVHKLRD